MNGEERTAAFWRRIGMAILSALCLSCVMPGAVRQASAHASLVRVDPADGAVVKAAPTSFTLVFSEPTSPLVLKLVRPDGSSTSLDRFVLRDATLDIEAPADLGAGTHVLSWRIVSEDGHPVGGSAVFSIGAPSAAAGAAALAPVGGVDRPVRGAIWIAKIALYVALFIGVGGSFFISWIGGGTPTATRVALWSLLVGLVATPLSVGLQGLDALGLPLAGLGDPQVWATGLSTSYGLTALVASAALASAIAALAVTGAGERLPNHASAITGAGGFPGAATRGNRPAGRALALLAYVAAGLALAASGHASAAGPQWLTRPAVFLHGIGIAFWAGSLVPLGTTLAVPPGRDGAAVLRRFSLAIPFAVLALAAAGGVLAAIQLRGVEALWTTDYGRLLLAKLALLAGLFLLAALNRYRLTAPALQGDGPAIRRLRRSVGVEIVLVLAIFAIAAGWRFTPPPRSFVEAEAAPASVHLHTGKVVANLTVTPGRAGPVRASVAVLTGDFEPLEAQEVTLVFSNVAAGIEQIRRAAVRTADGSWSVDDLSLPLPGRWRVRVDVLVSDFELAKLEDTIEILP